MDAIANDFENFPTIIEEVTRWGAQDGRSIAASEIFHSLKGLLESGLAKAYRLSPIHPPQEIENSSMMEAPMDYYFLLTAKGKRVVEGAINSEE